MLKKITTTILTMTMILLLTGLESSAQTRIRFRRGSAQASVSGRLAAHAKRTFVLSGQANQNLTADLTSGNGGVRFGDNNISLNYETAAGNNYVYIINTGKTATNFTLTVSIR